MAILTLSINYIVPKWLPHEFHLPKTKTANCSSHGILSNSVHITAVTFHKVAIETTKQTCIYRAFPITFENTKIHTENGNSNYLLHSMCASSDNSCTGRWRGAASSCSQVADLIHSISMVGGGVRGYLKGCVSLILENHCYILYTTGSWLSLHTLYTDNVCLAQVHGGCAKVQLPIIDSC